MQLKDAEKRSLDEILYLTLTTASGDPVSLRNMVDTQAGQGPIIIDRKDQQRLITVAANVSGRDLGSVAADVQARLNRIPRPAGYDLMVAGNFEEQQKAFNELILSLLQGFEPAVNLVSVRQAELDTSASLYELRGFVEAMLAETEIAYWNLVLAKKEIRIFEQSLAIPKQQLDEVEQQIMVGVQQFPDKLII